MKKVLIAGVAAFALLLTGCTDVPTRFGIVNIQENLFYFQDPKTDLCFASLVSKVEGGFSASVTNVECTDKVKANLVDMANYTARSY